MSNEVGGAIVNMVLGILGVDGTTTVPPYGPAGVGTFCLDIANGFTLTHRWITDTHKFRSGKERRISRNDAAQQAFRGSALLMGPNPRAIRAQFARYAAQGVAFLLALPHELLSLQANSSGAVVAVDATAITRVDWAKPGQRCVVARRDSTNEIAFVNAVVQSISGGNITLDIAPGTPGLIGGWIAPCVPVYLEPQQDFARYQTKAEEWQIASRMAIFDFAPSLATLDMATQHVSLAGNVVQSRVFGPAGNSPFVLDVNAGYAATGTLVESGGTTTIQAKTNVTTMGNVNTLLASSSLARLSSFVSGYVIQAADAFSASLSGAALTGDVGTGASLTLYAGDGTSRPVWDRNLDNPGTLGDSAHALTTILDHGGIPYALGKADRADWGRAVAMESQDQIDWQWLKLFLQTVKGCQKTFWLPTWRDDLTFVSKATNTVTVSTTDGSDFSAWWPYQRQDIQIVETSGTTTRARITAAVDNGNGTITLTIGTTLASSSISLISWLELSHFEGDEFSLSWKDGIVTL